MSIPVVALAAARIRAALPDLATYEGLSQVRAEGTGSTVIEVLDGGWWPSATGARHRVIQIQILSDRTRDSAGLPTEDDADARAWDVWVRLDPLLNDTGHNWAQVHTSRRSDGPSLIPIPDGDGSVLLTCRYEVSHD